LIEGTELPDPTGVVIEQESNEVESAFRQRMVDLTITKFELLNYQTYKRLRQLAPFGAGNPDPVFKMENMHVIRAWTSGPNKQNLSMRLGAPGSNGKLNSAVQQNGTYLRGASELGRLANVTHAHVVFCLESKEDDAKPEVWLRILDFEEVPQV
jgi:single-stranded-DNA-specific exonuclease